MFAAWSTAGERLKSEPGVRAVVLSGEGPDFCAGLDFGSFAAMRDGERLSALVDSCPRRRGWPGDRAARRIRLDGAPRPGHRGGDRQRPGRWPADRARRRHSHRRAGHQDVGAGDRWGLVPDMTGSQLLPELVGRDVAKELTFSGRVVPGEEAVALGLATRVDPDPRKAAFELARIIAGRNPHAIRAAKRLLDLAGRVDLETGFAAEQQEIGALIGSPNKAEAVAAEFGKRPPRFTDPG